MFNLQKIRGKEIYTFTVEGEMTPQNVEAFYETLAKATVNGGQVQLLTVVQDFPKFQSFKTLSAAAKLKLNALKHLTKCAVLSDKDWVETLLPFGNFLTPDLPIRHFDLDQRAEALAWLERKEPARRATPSPMHVEHVLDTPILRFTLDGEITDAGVTELYRAVQQEGQRGNVRLLGTIKDVRGIENFSTLLNGIRADLASFKFADRCALVADQEWVEKLAQGVNYVTPGLELKTFEPTQQAQALAWLQE